MTSFEIRYDRWCGWLLGLLGSGRRFSRVTVSDDEVEVRLGIAFRATIPRSSIVSTSRRTGVVMGWGAHGWNGRWLVNGSSHGIVLLGIDPVQRARVLGFPVKLHELAVSLVDPDGLAEALGLPLDQATDVTDV